MIGLLGSFPDLARPGRAHGTWERVVLRRIMDEDRILIVNLAKRPIGEGTSHLLGALLSTLVDDDSHTPRLRMRLSSSLSEMNLRLGSAGEAVAEWVV
jgi:hypothetical protein